MRVMYKKIKRTNWYISYLVHEKKVVELLFAAKGPDMVGWAQGLLFSRDELPASL